MSETIPNQRQRWIDLSGGQREFLRSLHGNPTTLEQMLKRQKVTSARFSAWMRAPKFRRALDDVMRALRRRRKLTVELGSLSGSEKLAQMIRSPKAHIARLASMSLLTLQLREAQAARTPERRKRGPSAGGAQADPPFELPSDLTPQRANELLDELERARASGKSSKEQA